MSRNIFNTSYKVKSDVNTEAEREYFNIEEGAYVTTSAGVWTVFNGEWVKIYPQSGVGSGLGWTRYDDDEWTIDNKLPLLLDTEIVFPNNGASIYRSYDGIDYYNPSTLKVLGDNANDVYMATVVFKARSSNANQCFLRVQLDSVNGTPYERVGVDLSFPKGNDAMHEFHEVFQYYITPDFIANGSQWKITAHGASAEVWDIIFFIQKTQSYA
jgi:hypothetical protein